MQRCADRVVMRCITDRIGDGDASGMSDPQVCISGRDIFCLPGMLAYKKVKIEKRCVKRSFTYPLAPQVILITCNCKVLQAVFAIQLKNRFLRARKKAVLFIRKEWLLTFVGIRLHV